MDFLRGFDLISILFWLFIAYRMFMGFMNGGVKLLFTILSVALGIGLGFLLCAPIGTLIYNAGAGAGISGVVSGAIGQAGGDLSTEMTKADLDVYYVYWVAQGNTGTMKDMVAEILHQGYPSLFIPEALYQTLDDLIYNAIPASGTFTFAGIIGTAIAQVACLGIAFAGVVLLIVIIGAILIGIVSWNIERHNKEKKKKMALWNRFLGLALGLGFAFFSLWSTSIGIKSFMTAFPNFSDVLTQSMGLDNPGYWNIGKFFFGIDFGYTNLLNWFFSMVHITPA